MSKVTSDSLQATDLLALVETGRELAAELDLDALLARILSQACALTDSPDSSIILHDQSRNDLYFAGAIGSEAATVLERWGPRRRQGIPIEGSKAGQVFSSGHPIVVEGIATDSKHFKSVDQDTGHSTQSMVCVPLSVAGQRLGVMQILNKRQGSYTPREVELLQYFAAQAAVAIRNAKLLDDLLAHMGWYASHTPGRDRARIMAELRDRPRIEELTVMFADMRGYNRLCQAMDRPEQMQSIMDEFLTHLTRDVLAHDGIVNKFLGDGLLALFRGEGAPLRAVRCAESLVTDMARLRQGWNEQTNATLDFLDIGVGIATDSVILGSIGTDRVRDFTVMGTGVNLAAHLTRDARDGRRILADKRTFLAVRRQLADYEGPEVFELRKPDQPHGRPYERYQIRRLVGSPELVPSAPPSTTGSVGTGPRAGAQPPTPAPSTDRTEVFISYSHHDRAWLKALRTHLKPYVRGRSLTVWEDSRIQVGKAWRAEIEAALGRARVAVLMVSPHFLESDFIASEELPALLASAQREGLVVVWFVLSACSYAETELFAVQAALDPERPLDSLSPADQNKAMVRVCQEIKSGLERPRQRG